MIVELENIEVMCVVAEARGVMASLESRLPALKRRKFYVVCFEPGADFRACVDLRNDEPDSLGLETWTILGGAYERRKI